MEALFVRDGLTIPATHLSVSFTRDLGGEGTPQAAARTPTTVELRLDVRGCGVLSEDDKLRVLGDRALRSDRRGTVRVVYGELPTRRRNLFEARRRLAVLVREALERDPSDVEAEEPARPRRGRAGLFKTQRGASD